MQMKQGSQGCSPEGALLGTVGLTSNLNKPFTPGNAPSETLQLKRSANHLKKLFLATIAFLPFVVWADYPIMSHRYAADPSALEFNGRLYVYCSHDEDNYTNSYTMKSIVCFSTEDLKNWTDHGIVFQVPRDASWASFAWAPSVIYQNGLFYLFFANGASGIGVATSSIPTGPFKDARGSALITSSTPGASTPTQWYFDPCVFVDLDGQAYLYFGGQYPTNSRVIKLTSNLLQTSGSATPLDTPDFFEAIHINRRDNVYYLTYCTRPEAGMVIACVTSTNPVLGFAGKHTVLPNPPDNVWNNNHHSIATFLGDWYIVYHNRAAALQNGLTGEAAVYKRSICIDKLTFKADGTINQVTPTTDGLLQVKYLNPYRPVEGETFAQQFGVETDTCNEGGMALTFMTNGSWVRIRGIDFGTGATKFFARVASGASGASIELRLDSLSGPLIGTCTVPNTGGLQAWRSVSTTVTNATGVRDLYLRFTGSSPLNLNWWQFEFIQQPSQNLIHRYEFNETSGSVVSDSWGGPAWNGTLPNSGLFLGGTLRLNSATQQFVLLPPGVVSGLTNFTIMTWVKLNSVANWTRIFDFGNNTTTNMFLTPQNGANGRLRFAITTGGAGAEQRLDGTFGLSTGVWYHVAITKSGSTAILYVNGAPVGTNSNMTLSPANLGITTNNYLGRSQYSADPYLNAEFDEFRIYNVALTPDQIRLAYTFGPDSPYSPDPHSGIILLDPKTLYQTIEGIGGATCFYVGWITAHPYKQEIYSNAFAGLRISMLRLGNWFRYTNSPDYAAYEVVSNANRVLGYQVPILMTSWAPPAFLKSNGQTGNGGTLLYTNGGFVYQEFAQYWYDSLQAYRSNGVWPTWISIQNEPDFEASYDSCILRPTEGVYNGTNYASYAKALEATYYKLTNLPSPPKILAPEPVGIGYGVLQSYANTLNPDHFYGLAYHLYHGTENGLPILSTLRATTNLFPTKPKFMTEYGLMEHATNMLLTAQLMHYCFVEGQVSGFNFWNLIWPWDGPGLVQIEFPWDRSRWTNAPPGTPTQSRGYWLSPAYWAMKHYSYYIRPGYRRIAALSGNADVLVSAYMSPDSNRVVCVLINTNATSSRNVTIQPGFQISSSEVYLSDNTNKFSYLGSAYSGTTLTPASVATIVIDRYIPLMPASNPFPPDGTVGVVVDPLLSWTSDPNAQLHAVYIGTSSNAVALATPASPEFLGFVGTNCVTPYRLAGGLTYYWRVDSIAYSTTNTGYVWQFSTAPRYGLKNRYSFNELTGTKVADSVGGPSWDGTLPNGGTWTGGTLSLSSSAQQYVLLPAGVVSGLTNFTIMTWVKLNSVANWTRIFDFGNNTTTNMFLTPQNGANGRLRFAITTGGAGAEQRLDGTFGLSTGVWYHVAITKSGSTAILYVNGAPVGTNSNMTLSPANLGITTNNYLGRSQYSADPYLNAEFDEFRIYNVALSPVEIAATFMMGPSGFLTTTAPLIGVQQSGSNLIFSWPIEHAGFTLQMRTNLTQGTWTLVPGTPAIAEGRCMLTIPIQSNIPAAFYRLIK